MKRFRFQLQTALEWRRRRMEIEQTRLAEFEGKRSELLESKAAAEESVAESRETIVRSAAVTAADLAALENYRSAVEHSGQRIGREAAQLIQPIEQQRRVLMEAARQFRLLEKLRHRRLDEWKKESDREIETEATELYLAKWVKEPEDGGSA